MLQQLPERPERVRRPADSDQLLQCCEGVSTICFSKKAFAEEAHRFYRYGSSSSSSSRTVSATASVSSSLSEAIASQSTALAAVTSDGTASSTADSTSSGSASGSAATASETDSSATAFTPAGGLVAAIFGLAALI